MRAVAFAFALALLLTLVACGSDGEPPEQARVPAVELRALDQQLVELGRPVYEASCAACHGASGEGGPTDWRVRRPDGSLPPPPHDETGHTWHHADGLLYRVIREGCAAYATPGAPPCHMPAFGDELSDEQIRAVIEFMRTWWGPDERAFQQEVTRNDPFP